MSHNTTSGHPEEDCLADEIMEPTKKKKQDDVKQSCISMMILNHPEALAVAIGIVSLTALIICAFVKYLKV